jgi:hypothetical protein
VLGGVQVADADAGATRTARAANATTAISAVTVAVSMMFMMCLPGEFLVAWCPPLCSDRDRHRSLGDRTPKVRDPASLQRS